MELTLQGRTALITGASSGFGEHFARLFVAHGANVVIGDRGGYEQPQRVPQQDTARRTGAPADDTGKFVARVLGSTEVVWKDIFTKEGQTYRAPKLVMFSGQTRSACGAEVDDSSAAPST